MKTTAKTTRNGIKKGDTIAFILSGRQLVVETVSKVTADYATVDGMEVFYLYAEKVAAKVGTKVFTIEGPGASAGCPSRTGEVTAVEATAFGFVAWIRFEDGSTEGCELRSIRSEVCGCGVYAAGSK